MEVDQHFASSESFSARILKAAQLNGSRFLRKGGLFWFVEGTQLIVAGKRKLLIPADLSWLQMQDDGGLT